MRDTIIATTECQWPYSKLPECSALKTQMTSPRLLCTFLLYPSLMHEPSGCDIAKWCQNCLLPFSMGKALHMCRRAALIHLHTCQHPHWLFSTTMYKPCCCFCIPNFKPVTYVCSMYVHVYVGKHVWIYMCACVCVYDMYKHLYVCMQANMQEYYVYRQTCISMCVYVP